MNLEKKTTEVYQIPEDKFRDYLFDQGVEISWILWKEVFELKKIIITNVNNNRFIVFIFLIFVPNRLPQLTPDELGILVTENENYSMTLIKKYNNGQITSVEMSELLKKEKLKLSKVGINTITLSEDYIIHMIDKLRFPSLRKSFFKLEYWANHYYEIKSVGIKNDCIEFTLEDIDYKEGYKQYMKKQMT